MDCTLNQNITQAWLGSTRKLKYNTLSDPKCQLRLISVKPASEHARIKASMKTFDAKTAIPGYGAVSYTWGDPARVKTISVNGTPVDVSYNCWYVLSQARRHRKGYLWIDALCINQQNDAEKGTQVARMSEIYSRAHAVYCAVGEHRDDSEWFCELIERFQARPQPVVRNEIERPGSEYVTVFRESFLKRDSDYFRFLKAHASFYSRPYWSHLWTLQEMVLGQRKEIWCGRSSLDFKDWMTLYEGFSGPSQPTSINMNYFSAIAMPSNGKGVLQDWATSSEDVAEAFDRLCSRKCTDARDVIYGSLSITHLSILPDYGKTPYQVATDAIHTMFVPNRAARSPLPAIMNFEQCHKMISKILARICAPAEEPTLHQDECERMDAEHRNESQSLSRTLSICLTYEGQVGRLSPEFLCPKEYDAKARQKSSCETSDQLAQLLVLEDRGVGFASEEARAGDLLVPLPIIQNKGRGRFLVLRARRSQGESSEMGYPHRFDVVGQAIIFGPVSLFGDVPTTMRWRNAYELNLHLTLYDMIKVCIQELRPPRADIHFWPKCRPNEFCVKL